MKHLILIMLAVSAAKVYAVNVNLFNHSHSPVYMMTEDTLTTDSLPNNTLIFSSYYNYTEDPIVETNAAGTERKSTIIEGMNNLHMGVGHQTSSRFLWGVSTYASQVWLPTREAEYVMGDTKVIGKYRMTGKYDRNSLALIPEVEIPTGSEEHFTGNGSGGAGMKLAFEREFDYFKININLGYNYSPGAEYRDMDYRHKMLTALGAYIPIDDKWGLTTETYMIRTLPFNTTQNPGEFYVGGRYQATPSWSIGAGAGVGNMNNYGSNEFRLLAGVKYIPKIKNRPFNFKGIFTRREKRIIREMLEINERIAFDHDSSKLNDVAKKHLKQIAELLKKEGLNFKKVIVEGYANRIGDKEYNQKLSAKRAASVRDFLVIEGGVDKGWLENAAFGEERAVDLNTHRETRDFNRRVEFTIIK